MPTKLEQIINQSSASSVEKSLWLKLSAYLNKDQREELKQIFTPAEPTPPKPAPVEPTPTEQPQPRPKPKPTPAESKESTPVDFIQKFSPDTISPANPEADKQNLMNRIIQAVPTPDLKDRARQLWKQSPLSQLYIETGRRSIAEQKSIDQIAQELKAQNQPALTKDQFKAIAELSRWIQNL